MSIDIAEFLRGLGEARERGEAAARRALDRFGEHVLADAQTLAPVGGGAYSPNDPHPGFLKASATSRPAEGGAENLTKVIGFNAVYAAVQHERIDFRHDQGQAKFLYAAMTRNAPKMGAFVIAETKAALGG